MDGPGLGPSLTNAPHIGFKMSDNLTEHEISNLIKFFSMYYRYPLLVENLHDISRAKYFRKEYRTIHHIESPDNSESKSLANLEMHSSKDMNWLMKLLHSEQEGVVFSIKDNKYAHQYLECISYFPGRRDVVLIHGSNDSYIRKEYAATLKRSMPMFFVDNKLGVVRATPTRVA